MRLWKRAIFSVLFLVAASCATVAAQSTQCPPDRVCLTIEQGRQALIDADTVKAQAQQILDLKQAVIDQKSANVDVKIELARVMGEKTGADQEVVRLTALVEFLNKNGRKKCYFCIQ